MITSCRTVALRSEKFGMGDRRSTSQLFKTEELQFYSYAHDYWIEFGPLVLEIRMFTATTIKTIMAYKVQIKKKKSLRLRLR